MTISEYARLANVFRNAIEEANDDNCFNPRDRMRRFPDGCCDDASEIFAYYLALKGIHVLEVNGLYEDDIPENKTNHVWLETDEGYVIDLTADQFMNDCHVYVGEYNDFYLGLSRVKKEECYNIVENERLYSDYKEIISYLA